MAEACLALAAQYAAQAASMGGCAANHLSATKRIDSNAIRSGCGSFLRCMDAAPPPINCDGAI